MKLNVPDMSCGHCKAAIEKAIDEAGGQAEVDLDARQVKVSGIEAEEAVRVIREAGYDAAPA